MASDGIFSSLRWFVTVTVLVFGVGSLSPQVSASKAVFEMDLWPGEGRPVFDAVSRTLVLREAPLRASKASATVFVKLRQRLSYDDVRYRTVAAGRIRALRQAELTGRTVGLVSRLNKKEYYGNTFTQANIAVEAGSSFEYLQYRAEGSCFLRVKGSVIDASPCPAHEKPKFVVETEPQTELWIHVAMDDHVGWLLVVDSNAKEVDREF